MASALRPGLQTWGRWAAAAAATAVGPATLLQPAPRSRCEDVYAGRKSSGVKTSATPPTLAPKVVQGPKSPAELIFDTLPRQRAVYLCGPIDDVSAKHIIAQLLVLEQNEPGTQITMYITSGGGKVWSGMGILDVMNFISSPVATVVVGHASSMAAIISSGGEPGRRFALPNARLMVHEPRKSAGSNLRAVDLEVSASQLRSTRELTSRTLSRHTGKTVEELEKLLDIDCYCTAEEALKLGLVDHIAEKIHEVLPKAAPQQQAVAAPGQQPPQQTSASQPAASAEPAPVPEAAPSKEAAAPETPKKA